MKEQKSNKGIIVFLIILLLILATLVVLLATETISFKPNKNTDVNTKKVTNTTTNTKTSKTENEIEEEPTPTKTQEETTTKEEAPSRSNNKTQKSSVETSTILGYYKDIVSIHETGTSNTEYKYAIADINNDKIPELFIYTSGFLGSTIIGEISVYTYDENVGLASSHYIVNVGTIQGRLNLNTILYKMNDGTLLSVYGHSGYEETATFKLENDWLIRTEFKAVESDNYTKGDTEIVFADTSDTSLFESYK